MRKVILATHERGIHPTQLKLPYLIAEIEKRGMGEIRLNGMHWPGDMYYDPPIRRMLGNPFPDKGPIVSVRIAEVEW